MVLIGSVKYACATCIKGHRSSTCNHETRPLIEIKKKGRPVTQCVHCRELRKTKQVHVKCLCEGRPEASTPAPRTVLSTAALTAAPTPATKTAANTPRSNSTLTNSLEKPPCDCNTRGGSCECCTPKHPSRQSAAAALDGHSGGKPLGLTRGHTYHASSNTSSMNHEASLNSHQVTKGGSSLQRSTSLHGTTTGGSSSPHPNFCGSHHPQPQHHHARHFAPYQIAHHNHHHHARFDVAEEEKPGDLANKITATAGSYRRHRSSSVSHSDMSRPFPPATPVYVNGSGAVSLPDVLAWSSGDVSPISPYNQQANTDPLLADAARSSTFLPQPGSDYDVFIPAATDELIHQLGNSNRTFGESATSEGYPAHFRSCANTDYTGGAPTTGDLQYGGLPEFHFAPSADVGFEPRDESPLFSDNAVYGGPGANMADYDPMIASCFLPLPQQANASLSASGAGSSPPSMTGSGSLTSRSSSRASGAAFDLYEMTAIDTSSPGDRGRLPRQCNAPVTFPVADPFESDSTTAIPSFDAFDRPLQNRPSPLDIDKSHSPISTDVHDDGNGTQFPAWPHRAQQQQLSSSPMSGTNLSSAGLAPFEGDSYEFANPGGGATAAALAYGGHRGPSLEFDDNSWAMRA